METIESINKALHPSLYDEATFNAYKERLAEGLATRDENPSSHFCVYFLPYNPATQNVFLVHHKKSGLWLSPGGHMDKGEVLHETLNREIHEELGLVNFFKAGPSPFLLTITPVKRNPRLCKMHYDLWYLVSTDGHEFHIDPREFHETKWLSLEEAKRLTPDEANQKALAILDGLKGAGGL